MTGSHGSVSSDRPDVTSRGLDDAMAAYVDLSRVSCFKVLCMFCSQSQNNDCYHKEFNVMHLSERSL